MLPGNERVYLILTNLYETYGKRDTYSVYLSRKDFSEVTGVSERTITRALKDLEEQKPDIKRWMEYRDDLGAVPENQRTGKSSDQRNRGNDK